MLVGSGDGIGVAGGGSEGERDVDIWQRQEVVFTGEIGGVVVNAGAVAP